MNRVLGTGVLAVAIAAWAASGLVDGRSPPERAAPASPPTALLPLPVGSVHSTSCYPQTESRPLVWVLDGAGDLKGYSSALAQATRNDSPVEFAVFPWSHGYRRLLKDQTDWAHARLQGARLAAAIRERQAREPHRRTVIAAHSAGCAVALTATESLPPDSIDRILLLAPSVSTGYNIRPALWAAREGVDVFCSKKDWVALGFVTRVVGTTDRFGAKAAGRHGFQMRTGLNDLEGQRLRQHFWTPQIAWTGHNGGHHGMYAPTFLTAYVIPLMIAR